eukprot:m.768212 g.768212  ORF g.768212 m.768212 type:complete len:62 (-) comp59074_c0_seq40:3145-3330(-)
MSLKNSSTVRVEEIGIKANSAVNEILKWSSLPQIPFLNRRVRHPTVTAETLRGRQLQFLRR